MDDTDPKEFASPPCLMHEVDRAYMGVEEADSTRDKHVALQDALPAGVAAYKRTPIFDQDTVPAGLRREHRTKEGVWALIHVLEGRLLYRVLTPHQEKILTPATRGIVCPQQPHEIELIGAVQFFVEFHAVTPLTEQPHALSV
ncbi:MAG: DUF1971 domain-containing protein [Rhodobacteraceae bacterium]|nr:DUF1971 domain-containing protein [Paracoccaceae bacterium]